MRFDAPFQGTLKKNVSGSIPSGTKITFTLDIKHKHIYHRPDLYGLADIDYTLENFIPKLEPLNNTHVLRDFDEIPIKTRITDPATGMKYNRYTFS